MGRNGSGKSTLLKLLAGLSKPSRGSVRLARLARAASTPAAPRWTRSCASSAMCRRTPARCSSRTPCWRSWPSPARATSCPPDPAADRALLARLGLAEQAERYPRDLSTGQRQRVALAAILVAEPLVLLLDEPTRGLDYAQKEALTAILRDLRRQGRAVLLATHDVELVARSADRVVLLGEGAVVVDGPTRQVMTGSLVFASQVNKLYRDPRYLVVEDAVWPN